MKIRCDEAMRRSKEKNSRWYRAIGVQKWKCDHNCERCICGMKMNGKAEWEHNHGVQE